MNHTHFPSPQAHGCNTVADDLKAYADRELPLLRRLFVRRHIATCSDCQKEIAAMQNLTDDLKNENPAPPPLAESLRTRLLAAAPDVPMVAPRVAKPAPLWRRRPLMTASVALASLTGVVLFGQMYGETMRTMSGDNATGSAMMMYAQDYDAAQSSPGSTGEMAKSSVGGDATAASAPMAEAAPSRVVRSPIEMDSVALAKPAVPTAPTPTRLMVARNTGEARSSYARFQARAGRGFPRSEAEVAGASLDAGSLAYMERKVNRDAQLGISVERGQIEAKSEQVEDTVKASGGYIASNNLLTEGGYRTASIIAKVPEAQFESAMRKFAALGKVNSKSVNAEDITEQTGDATTAEEVLKNEVDALARKLKARTSEDTTARREYELRQAKIQLAQTRGRLGALRRMAALSTITVSLTERPIEVPKPAEDKTGFWSGMGETNRAATAAFQTALRLPLVMLAYIGAFFPIWVPLLIWWRVTEMRKAKMAMLAQAGAAPDSPNAEAAPKPDAHR